jgi:hypothetical protein
MTYAAMAALAVGALGASAHAQQQQQQSAQSAPITVTGTPVPKKAADPNEVVCEKQQDVSSRLVFHKVCMTRSEWNEQRRLDRQEIDKAQVQRPM